MNLKLILDFDGVLFNSAFEAYSVCNHQGRGDADLRQNVSFEEFLAFRAVVTDAWQYNRLYARQRLLSPAQLPAAVPDAGDWAFAERFFEARAEMMADPDWPKIMAPYDFFFLVKPLLLAYPENFAILSTRNVESIRRTMEFYDANVIEVLGQEDIRRCGSKVAVASGQGWLDQDNCFAVYVDDMNAHLEPFEGKVHLPLHANWGYDQGQLESLNPNQIFLILNSLLKLSKK